MFSKNRNQHRQPAETGRHLRDDFNLRAPYWSYRPLSYTISDSLTGLQTTIDLHLKKLFAGEIDAGNGDVLQNLILDATQQAEAELAGQRELHRDQIKTFHHRRTADQTAFELERQQLQDKLYQALQDRTVILTRMESQKFRKEVNSQ